MKNVRWGILSTAGIAQKALLPAFGRADNAEVVAIASSRLAKAEAVAHTFGIEKAYEGYDALLDDPDIDAVYIPLPNHLHKQWVIKAAKKGKHILCEKPATIHAEEFREMEAICREHGVIFMEAFMYYFHPQHDRVKEIIDSGEIGDVTYMQAGFTFYLDEEKRADNIRMSEEKGGGSIYDIGCYTIHSLRNILRAEPESVHIHAVMDPVYQVDTDVEGYLTFPNGVRATFQSSFSLAFRNEYRIFGTAGSITVPRAYRPDNHGGEGLIIIEKSGSTREETINSDQYKNQVEHISEAILEGTQVKHSEVNTLNNLRVIDACYESIHNNKRIDM